VDESIALALIERPTEWALVRTGTVEERRNLAQYGFRIRNKKDRVSRRIGVGGDWEVEVRTVPSRPESERVRVYARFMPHE
jgi:hypothetical protein